MNEFSETLDGLPFLEIALALNSLHYLMIVFGLSAPGGFLLGKVAIWFAWLGRSIALIVFGIYGFAIWKVGKRLSAADSGRITQNPPNFVADDVFSEQADENLAYINKVAGERFRRSAIVRHAR